MTQAIATNEMLERRGHRVAAVLVGSNPTRNLPAFFDQAFPVPVRSIVSPGFALKNGRGISLAGSGSQLIRKLPALRRSIAILDETIQTVRPDLIINFLEPLMGVYNLLRPHPIPVLAVGHQFMIDHPDFVKVQKFALSQFGMRRYVRLTGARSARLALSFYPAPDLAGRRMYVCPPILRRQLFDLKTDSSGGYLLVYLLNHGYATEIIRWHREHPEIPIHCFYDKPGAPAEEQLDTRLTFHRIHGDKFLQLMAASRGVACTAGFESVSEGAYLGKPLLLVPVENHLEQYLNACDAEETGLGLRDSTFRLERLLTPPDTGAITLFRDWVTQAEDIVMRVIEAMSAPARTLGRSAYGRPWATPGRRAQLKSPAS